MLPVPTAILFMTEGLRRNEPVIAYPSISTAVNSAVGAWPAPFRSMFLTLTTSSHHVEWRMGEVEAYKEKPGRGKADDYYAKERKAETIRQRGDTKTMEE
jgi:hypothetical protein